MKRVAPQGIEIAPASDFCGFRGLNHSPASIFSKILSFRNVRVQTPDAWLRITFLIRNAQTSQSQQTIPHTPADIINLTVFSNNIVSGHENQAQSSKIYGLYGRNSWSNRPCRRYYSTVQPLYESHGMKRGRAARH